MGNHSPGKIIRAGRKAQMEGYSLEDNPYKIRLPKIGHATVAADYWEEGWKEAQEEEQEDIKREIEMERRSTYEIPLSEFENLGDLMDAIEHHKDK